MVLCRPSRRWVALFLLVALVVTVLSPPVRGRLKATLVAVEMLGAPVRPLSWTTPAPHEREVRLSSTEADLYRARGFSSTAGLVLVHGANPGGKDDPRVVELARSLARTGRTVVVPQLGLRHERLDPLDRRRILESVRWLADGRRVGIVAFSYGAALALVALGDEPAAQDEVAFVAAVGTYFDLRHVVRGVTTATVPYRGRDVPWEPDPRGRDILAASLADLLGGAEGRVLIRAWERRDPLGLSPGARSVYALVSNREPGRVEELIDGLPERLREVADELSPSRVVERIRVPVFALHALDDPASPPTESRLLVEALGDRTRTELVEVGNLRHVTPTAPFLDNLREGLRVAGFAGHIIGAQEGWPRP